MRSSVPRAQRSAFSGFTRVFDTLWRCAAEPGPMTRNRSPDAQLRI
jgi:hypothetical protein